MSTPPPQQPAGPSEFTRMFSAPKEGMAPPEPAPQPPPAAPAAPPKPAAKWPIYLFAGILFLLLVAAIILVVRG
jgi:hypothetical protein